ncbi:MAG: DUF4837 family protein [Flavobacteriaceae bacterium]|mgnify:FL=1|jgi:hypothetical protein|nr:DUF4837 family protein [Flavobacteriaceae bacterium]MDG2349445.1 DUF4837 family protein [Flavobacteriaceae bacterium]
MKPIIILIISAVILSGCNSNSKVALSASSGNINNLSVVIDNNLWEGSVGDNIRSLIGASLYGLPQDEPLFTLRQMPTSIFTGFVRKNRIVLKVVKGEEAGTQFYKDSYAKPQKMVVVSGFTNSEIIDQIKENADKIISVFKFEEIKEKQRRILKSINKNNNIETVLGVTMDFPSAYRVAKEEGDFFWLRRDIQTGTINFLVYEIPLNQIRQKDNPINEVIKLRDSIGKAHIPGPLEGTYMITEEAYTPAISKTLIGERNAYETRSTWQVKNAFMAGPFLNYVIKDEQKQRFVVFEGFVFAPSVGKRDYMFELEAIAKSIKFKP